MRVRLPSGLCVAHSANQYLSGSCISSQLTLSATLGAMVRTNTCQVFGARAQLAEVAKRRVNLIGAETGQFRATLCQEV